MREPTRPSVSFHTPLELVDEARRGTIRVPPIQRRFKWRVEDVTTLFDSLLHGYPIGSLLLWRHPAPPAQMLIGPLQVDVPAVDSALWIIDGQQRITALVGALTHADTTTDERFAIHLDLARGIFRARRPDQPTPDLWLPVSRLTEPAALFAWLSQRPDLTSAQWDLAHRAFYAVRDYRVPAYVVDGDERSVQEMFARLNTTGVALSRAEVFDALHAGFASAEDRSLSAVGAVAAELGFGSLSDELSLACVLAYKGEDPWTGRLTAEPDWADTFRDIAFALRSAIEFLQADAGIPHRALLPFTEVLPVLVRFVRLYGPPAGRAARLLRRWVWRSAVAVMNEWDGRPRVRPFRTALGRLAPATQGEVSPNEADSSPEAVAQVAAAQALLRVLPRSAKVVMETRPRPDRPAGRLTLLGMLAADPIDLGTGAPVDVRTIFDEGVSLPTIRPGSVAITVANVLISTAPSAQPVHTALAAAPAHVAASHLVDERAQEALRDEDWSRLFDRREDAITTQVRRHVDLMAEWGARDGPTVADLMRRVA